MVLLNNIIGNKSDEFCSHINKIREFGNVFYLARLAENKIFCNTNKLRANVAKELKVLC
jgi:hypothetical protein